MAASDKLPRSGCERHGCCFIILLLEDPEMTGINPAALLEKITYGDGAFIVDNAIRSIDELIAKLRDEGLDGDFIDGAIGWNTGNNIAKRDYLAQLGMYTRYTVVQTPEEMNGRSHEGGSVDDRYGARAHHAYLGVCTGI